MSASGWTLHSQLAADCHQLGRLGSSHLLLHRNAALHWFILVPETEHLDLLDLPSSLRTELLDEAARVGDYLKSTLAYPRVNVGALGLLVPQLHLHVVGRRENDPCWPAPVWGNLSTAGADGSGYSEEQLAALRAAMLAGRSGI